MLAGTPLDRSMIQPICQSFDGPGQNTVLLPSSIWPGPMAIERTVGPEIMPDVARLQRVVPPRSNGMRICARCAQQLAPRVRRLKIDARSWPQRRLHLKRMVVGVAEIRLQGCGAELRIGLDEVLRESVQPQHRAVDAGRNVRQVGIVAGVA